MSNTFISSSSVSLDKNISIAFDRNDTKVYSFSFSYIENNEQHYRELIIHQNNICYKSPLIDEISTSVSDNITTLSNVGNNIFNSDLIIRSNYNQQNVYFVGSKSKDTSTFTFYEESSNKELPFTNINTHHYSNINSISSITPLILMDDSSDSLLMISVNNDDLELLTSDYEISITDEYNYSTIVLKQDSEIISSYIIPITENRIKITLCDFGKYISLSQFNNGQFEHLGQFKFSDKKLPNQKINPRLAFEGDYNIKNITRNF